MNTVLVGAISLLIGVLLVAIGFLAAVAYDIVGDDDLPKSTSIASSTATEDRPGGVDFGVLAEIYGILEQDFIEPDRVDSELLYEGAINGLFDSLNDPHSTYIDPTTYAISRSDLSGTFQGIGATVSRQGDEIVIVQPFTDSPAEQAGVRPGDAILEVNGESAIGWTTDKAVLQIRGRLGYIVSVSFRE